MSNSMPEQAPEASTRSKLLGEVDGIINGNRAVSYGKAEDNFLNIANFWTVYLTSKGYKIPAINALDVAVMLDLMKTARIATNPTHRDSWVDKIGYATCGAGIREDLENQAKKNDTVGKAVLDGLVEHRESLPEAEDFKQFFLKEFKDTGLDSLLGSVHVVDITIPDSKTGCGKPKTTVCTGLTNEQKGKALLEFVKSVPEGSSFVEVGKNLLDFSRSINAYK